MVVVVTVTVAMLQVGAVAGELPVPQLAALPRRCTVLAPQSALAMNSTPLLPTPHYQNLISQSSPA